MAILEKRKSVNQLPRFERYQDTRGGDRAAALRGETPVTSAIRQLAGTSGYAPMADQGYLPMGANQKSATNYTGRASGYNAPLTSAISKAPAVNKGVSGAPIATKGATTANAVSKTPTLTSGVVPKGTTTPKTLTSTGTGAATKTAGKTTATTPKTTGTGSTLANTLTSALAGAGVGLGTKAVIDKLTGAKKAVTDNTVTGGTAGTVSGTGLTSKTNPLGTNLSTVGNTTGTTSVVNPVTTTKVTAPVTTTKSVGSVNNVVDPAQLAATKLANAKTAVTKAATNPLTSALVPKAGTSGPKTPVGATKPTTRSLTSATTEDQSAAETARLARLAGTDTTVGGDGTDTTAINDGTTTQTMDDGTVITLDANGDTVSYTDTDGNTFDADGNPITSEDTTIGGDGNDTLGGGGVDDIIDQVENDDGTTTTTYGDGSTETTDITGAVVDSTDATTEDTSGYFTDDQGNIYDSTGVLYQYADGTLASDDGTEQDQTYTDEYGDVYDANGILISEADHSDYVSEPDEYGTTYDWNGNVVSEGDHSGYTQTDEEGNVFDWDGNIISYADGTTPDDYTTDDYTTDNSGDTTSEDYLPERKGGLIHMAAGGDTTDDSDPVSEEDNGDGTVTQTFDDGSTITYNATGDVVDVTDTEGSSTMDAGGGDILPMTRSLFGSTQGGSGEEDTTAYPNSLSTTGFSDINGNEVPPPSAVARPALSIAPGDYPASNDTTSEGAAINPGIQYFDDGSSIETFDDGTSITYDADGNPFKSTDINGNQQIAQNTTYDDQGNQIVSDYYGNIVKVLDPNGNVIPLGAGRVNQTGITNAGGQTGVGLGGNKTTQEKVADTALGNKSGAAIDDLLSQLNSYQGAGAAGAVLGALLGNSDLFGSSNAGGGNNVDMSKVGVINPRTTDFGIGPANYVGYDQYGTPEQMPELYGNELYQNLNAPGFNEVNPGDYARMDEEMYPNEYTTQEEYDDPYADQTSQGMADGGQPKGGLGGMSTFYTFGTPVNPLDNLRNPKPMQTMPAPPQPMQQQGQINPNPMAPTGNMQQSPVGNMQQNPNMEKPNAQMMQQNPMDGGLQGLRSGGLPAWSNVPVTNGRLNFRDGAPVHGPGDGQSDDIPAMLADGEYVIDADTVAQIGNGSTKAGAAALDKFRENIRAHKRSAPINKIPPKTKALTSYLKGAR